MSISLQLQKLVNSFLPQTCALCHEQSNDQFICDDCLIALPWQENFCSQCAVPLAASQLCGSCIKKPPAFDVVIAPLRYEIPLQFIITQFKFHEKIRYANVLAWLIQKSLISFYRQHSLPEIILSVPLSAQRLKARGYNQALEIAKPLAKTLTLPLAKNHLIKTKHTIPQSELDFTSRHQNIKNSFALDKPLIEKHVALLDDVVTTGSTVNEIAALLKKQGALRVDVWCIARTGLKT